jgi:hypothetical protein
VVRSLAAARARWRCTRPWAWRCPARRPGISADLGTTAVMWGVMMVAMMLPSATPLLVLFARSQRPRVGSAEGSVRTGLLAAGYLVVWLGWSGLAARAAVGAPRLAAALAPRRAHQRPGRWRTAHPGRALPGHAVEIRVPDPLSIAAGVHARPLARGSQGRCANGRGPRRLLRRMLLGADGAALRGRRG